MAFSASDSLAERSELEEESCTDELELLLPSDPVQYTSICTVLGGFLLWLLLLVGILCPRFTDGDLRLLAGDRENRLKGYK